MHSLANLADEALGLILRYDPTCPVSLMLCGCHALTARVIRTCQSFETPRGLTVAYKWPRMLRLLPNLVSVDFSAEIVDCPFSDVLEEIKNLPSSLKKLTVSFHGSAKILKLPVTRLGPPPSQPANPVESIIWNVASSFPTLEELDLSHAMSNAPYILHQDLKGSSLDIFPSTLRKLSIPNVAVLGDYSLLPRSLTWLSVGGGIPSESVILTLPSSLTYLAGIRAKGPEEVRALPRTLEYAINAFDLRGPTIDAGYMHRGSFQHIPPNLKAINCLGPAWPPPWVNLLPRTLTDVCLESKDKTCNELRQLPPTVTKLSYFRKDHLTSLNHWATQREGFWSPSLQTLEMEPLLPDKTDYIPHQELVQLPQTITELFNVAVDDEGGQVSIFKNASSLPPKLETLSIYARPYFVPEGGVENFFGEDEVEEVDASAPILADQPPPEATPLPSTLKKLIILPFGAQEPLSLLELRAIPRTLTALELLSLDPSHIPELPPNLLSLSINLLEGSITSELIKALSRHLTYLKLKHTLKAQIDPLALRDLPSGLHTLVLAKIDINHLADIPTTVRRLGAVLNVPKATHFDVSFLPARWLQWLSHYPQLTEKQVEHIKAVRSKQ